MGSLPGTHGSVSADGHLRFLVNGKGGAQHDTAVAGIGNGNRVGSRRSSGDAAHIAAVRPHIGVTGVLGGRQRGSLALADGGVLRYGGHWKGIGDNVDTG